MFHPTTFLLLLPALATGSTLWDGRMNDYNDTSILSTWSWSNPVGPYQTYIHGTNPLDTYIALSPTYRNPSTNTTLRGLQLTIDNTSHWSSQPMLRTELIPQTTSPITTGPVTYHFSLSHTLHNPPSQTHEHQLCFFESHFTELKFGLDGSQIQWYVGGNPHWNTTLEADVWQNFAYAVDFSAGTVTLWHSFAGEDLVRVAGPVEVATVSDGKDWHLGVLRLPSTRGGSDEGREDWRFSGVFVEGGEEVTVGV